ncbi:sensor histidine kinase [Geomonas anaerohicana]|uniref:histidine kinase n=1 Tax=Geomonas anaerohicana TaxID=2798583 RepID=A0ABS0Y8W5_9BACT|nr:ATP-binding protein [Geomonas anaerohicana]MBJ6748741.1 GHKL domain-containing protein [Geomonas anaerohicana]
MDRQRLLLELELHQTELELQNQELQAAWERADERAHSLELAVKELESFSYAVSHDLRAPLRHINGYLSILAHDFVSYLPEEAQRLLERSCRATRDMSRLIDDLLDLAKVSRIKIKSRMVNLSSLAHAVIDRLTEGNSGRQVEVVIAEGLFVQGDPALLGQLMWNLLENAWKYTSTTEAAKIEVGRVIVDDKLIIFVKDNGVGFDSIYKDNLFDVFQRLHGREFEGNGIGLATVKHIIERHQGRIWAESEKGEGAIFFFTLP